jgi:hypothetical protein
MARLRTSKLGLAVFQAIVLALLALGLLRLSPSGARASSAAEVRFSNLNFSSGFTSLPSFGGHGIQVADVNGDDWLDVYVTNIFDPAQDRPDLLFINQKSDPPRFEEMARQAGVSDEGFYNGVSEESHAAVFADLDNDGDFDLFNAHTWSGHNRLYRNDGQGRFTDITASAGIEVTDLGSRGVAAGDMTGDGLLDIVVSAWQDAQPIIYWNQGNLFFDRQRLKGVDNRPFANQGITVADYDGDFIPDLALTAYEFLQEEGVGPIALLSNEGFRFQDATEYAGLRYDRLTNNIRGTNGWSFADVDNDGHLDLLIAGTHGSKLYRNSGDGRFRFLQRFEGNHYTAAFGDVDNDGDVDLYIAGQTVIYLNDGKGSFSATGEVGLSEIGEDARSAVFADMNNDGALDLLIASKMGVNTFFLNQTRSGQWLKVSLVGPNGSAGAFGAKVFVYAAGQLGQAAHLKGFREARSATGYCSQDPPVLHFGLDGPGPYDVLVRFPDGSSLTRTGVSPGQLLRVDASRP